MERKVAEDTGAVIKATRAGEVVYVVRDNVAYQAIIETGIRQDGFIEIKSGLQADETIVVDGAGFLTDKAPVKISF